MQNNKFVDEAIWSYAENPSIFSKIVLRLLPSIHYTVHESITLSWIQEALNVSSMLMWVTHLMNLDTLDNNCNEPYILNLFLSF